MITVIIILLLFILVISIYQLIILNRVKKNTPTDTNFDVKYFELKYQTESYVKIFSIIITFGAYLGYNSFVNTKKEIETAYIEPIKKYESKIDSMNHTIQGYESFIKNFNLEKAAIQSVLLKTGEDAKGIEKNINLLAASKINQTKVYVGSIIVEKPQTYYFKDIPLLVGGKLPKFKKSPFILLQSRESADNVAPLNVTTESFELDNDWGEKIKFYILFMSEE